MNDLFKIKNLMLMNVSRKKNGVGKLVFDIPEEDFPLELEQVCRSFWREDLSMDGAFKDPTDGGEMKF